MFAAFNLIGLPYSLKSIKFSLQNTKNLSYQDKRSFETSHIILKFLSFRRVLFFKLAKIYVLIISTITFLAFLASGIGKTGKTWFMPEYSWY